MFAFELGICVILVDDLKDVNELASKYPESRPYINRKRTE